MSSRPEQKRANVQFANRLSYRGDASCRKRCGSNRRSTQPFRSQQPESGLVRGLLLRFSWNLSECELTVHRPRGSYSGASRTEIGGLSKKIYILRRLGPPILS